MIKNKTNAMRILDGAKIKYEILEYVPDENDLKGTHVAEQIGFSPDKVFKTLVAHGDKTGYIVFCIPSCCEIDLKRAAQATGNKKIEMVHVKELLSIAGYVRGACSPIGMKKKFPTFFDKSATKLDKITVSGGIKGAQLLISSTELIEFTGAKLCDVIR
ncbi:MAG: Cys-tRNA(Pro) deacylase, partial [Clostridia bacterium]|nr:Cys-tRNA(Pro) deacylase [Clostridia bacterium]